MGAYLLSRFWEKIEMRAPSASPHAPYVHGNDNAIGLLLSR